nr:hypothetical protein BaRGS_001028 [Batillaria attramentaria]
MAESEQEKTRPASGSDIRTEGSSDKADNPDEETDPFDKIIARIKRDISEKAKRHPGSTGDAGGNWRSKDRHYSVWECRTPFVFTSARLDRIRRIEEEELETGPEGAGDSERRRAFEATSPELYVFMLSGDT